jgi:tetratricopeptide (TPR) repeat protein
MLGKRTEAIDYYNNALAINPQLIDAHLNLGICYFYEGKLREAANHINQVIALDPHNPKALDLLKQMVE